MKIMNSIVKTILISIIGLFLNNTMYSQESAMSAKEKEDLERELTAKRDELFRSNGLNTMNAKTLKTLVGDRICYKWIDGFCVNLGGKYLLKAFSFYLTINTLINIKKL